MKITHTLTFDSGKTVELTDAECAELAPLLAAPTEPYSYPDTAGTGINPPTFRGFTIPTTPNSVDPTPPQEPQS